MLRLVLVVLATVFTARSIPISNGVTTDPEVDCGSERLQIDFDTDDSFVGNIYVKGFHNDPACSQKYNGTQMPIFMVSFDDCNVQRTRSLNPRGIFVETTVVVSFHPLFITKIDRAFRFQCFYMESDKTVSQDIEVSEYSTELFTIVQKMPVCRYDILNGGPDKEPIHFANIGRQVYHKWTCDSDHAGIFCMRVYSCTVADINGELVQILDEKGCALDRYILNNLEYPEDLVAGQEAHVYKFADREELFYQCQIELTVKEPHQECVRPVCEEPSGFNAVVLNEEEAGPPAREETLTTTVTASSVRGRTTRPPARPSRRFRRETTSGDNVMDVRAELTAINVPKDASLRQLLDEEAEELERLPSSALSQSVCVSPLSFSVLVFCAFVCSIIFVVLAGVNFRIAARKHLAYDP